MLFAIKYFIKRVLREGAKSVAVPLLSFTLIILITTLSGIKQWLDFEYNDTMENYPVIAEVSDLSGDKTDGLKVGINIVNLFTEPDSALSLYEHTGQLLLKRSLDVETGGSGTGTNLTGITAIAADDGLDPETGTVITFFDGYDEDIFKTGEYVCIINENMLEFIENGVLKVTASVKLPGWLWWYADPEHNPGASVGQIQGGSWYVFVDNSVTGIWMSGQLHIDFNDMFQELEEASAESETFTYEMDVIIGQSTPYNLRLIMEYNAGETIMEEISLMVAGTFSSADNDLIYCPFWTVIEFLEEFNEKLNDEYAGIPLYSERLSITVADNRELDDFKDRASLSFSRARPVMSSKQFAMTIYDSTFYETIEPLLQNTVLVDIAIPFVYVIAVAVGFLASTLLTRQRKSEFAVLRSVGMHKRDVFTGVLSEHLILSLTGAAFGCALALLIFKELFLQRPAVLLGCYLLGTIFAAARVAGTNVLKVMKEKET